MPLSVIAEPGSHLKQRVRSSVGAVPAARLQTAHMDGVVERGGLTAASPPSQASHSVAPEADHVPGGHPSHSRCSVANSPAAQTGGGVETAARPLAISVTLFAATTRTWYAVSARAPAMSARHVGSHEGVTDAAQKARSSPPWTSAYSTR